MDPLFDAIKRELETEGLVTLSATQWEEIVKAYRKFASMCAESINREACAKRLMEYKDMFKKLFKYRIYKVLKFESVPEDSMDSKLLALILALVKDYVDSLDEVVADEKGRVYVIVKRRLEVGKAIAYPNELLLMDLMEAIALSAFGYVELLRLPSEVSESYSWMKSERVHTSHEGI